MTGKSLLSYTTAIYEELLRFQRRRGFRRRVFDIRKLSNVHVRILALLDSQPGLRPTNIATQLRIRRAPLSKLLDQMHSRGIVSISRSNTDGRQRFVTLTPAGTELIHSIDGELVRITTESIGVLSLSEQSDLLNFLQILGDGLGKFDTTRRQTEHPLNFELTKISVLGGMFGGGFYGSTLTIEHIQLLDVLELRPGGIDLQSLVQLIRFEKPALLRSTKKLRSEGLIEGRPTRRDKRALNWRLTDKGFRKLREHKIAVGKKFAAALHGLNEADAIRALELVTKVGQGGLPLDSEVIQDQLAVRAVTEPTERQQIRGFCIEELVRQRKAFSTTGMICEESGIVLALTINGQIRGAIDLYNRKRTWKAANIIIASEENSSELRERFLHRAEQILRQRYEIRLNLAAKVTHK